MKDCGFEDHEVGDDGIFHAVAEALTVACFEKSWDNIISVGVNPDTNEGVVRYKDSVLADPEMGENVFLGVIHLFTFFASQVLAKCYKENMTSDQEYVEYALATVNEMSDEDNSHTEAILSIVIPLAKYLPFIYACSKKLAYSRGRTLLGSTVRDMFNEMGFSLEDDNKD